MLGEPLHHLPLQLIDAPDLLLRQELTVNGIIFLSQVQYLLAVGETLFQCLFRFFVCHLASLLLRAARFLLFSIFFLHLSFLFTSLQEQCFIVMKLNIYTNMMTIINCIAYIRRIS